ncbi:uncharacterized protein LOC133037801 [Cannabis sativa]|uniref:uncharacterized protein LOC133037801 n=1 Tax=Cannabis sativa TaxID=3483 RepID=UPI0029CA027F|nr:uncharacterized protein LOC133037801 [Cannabis sativa]
MVCWKRVTNSDLKKALEIPRCAAVYIIRTDMLINNQMHFVVGEETYNIDVRERKAGIDDLRYSVRKLEFRRVIDGRRLQVGDTLYFAEIPVDVHHPQNGGLRISATRTRRGAVHNLW